MQNIAMVSLYRGLDPSITSIATLAMTYWQNTQLTPAGLVQSQMDWVIPTLRAQPKGCRTLWLENILEREADPTRVDPVQVFRKGIDISTAKAALLPLSKRLKYAKLPIDLIFLDLENGFSFWNMDNWDQNIRGVERVLADPRAKATMPAWVRTLTPASFDWSNPNMHDAIRVWNRWNAAFILGTFKKLLLDSGLFDIPDPQTGRIRRPCIVNFGYHLQKWSTMDVNGWQMPNVSVDGCSCNPSVYMYTADYPWIVNNYQHNSLWNRLIYSINMIRSSLAVPNSRVFPILDWATSRHPWVWEQLVAHSVRAGISRNNGNYFLMWDPYQVAQDDQIAGRILNRHDEAAVRPGALPPIDYDVDQFETNGLVTTYTEFLTAINSPWLGSSGRTVEEGLPIRMARGPTVGREMLRAAA